MNTACKLVNIVRYPFNANGVLGNVNHCTNNSGMNQMSNYSMLNRDIMKALPSKFVFT